MSGNFLAYVHPTDMNRKLEEFPGVIWNFSQPISDNMEEAVSGVKGELAVKLYGRRSANAREHKSRRVQARMAERTWR